MLKTKTNDKNKSYNRLHNPAMLAKKDFATCLLEEGYTYPEIAQEINSEVELVIQWLNNSDS